MATSGSYDYSRTAAQLINGAAKNLGVLGAGETIDSSIEADMLVKLNLMLKQYQGTSDGSPGVKIHTRQRVFLFPAKGQQTYLIGPASTDSRATTQYGRTTISALEALGQTVISITSNTDTTTFPGTTVTMTAADIIGIELNDGTIHWSTISGTPASTATIVAATTAAASAGRYVYWFTSRAQRFPVIESAMLRYSGLNEVPLGVYTDARQYDQGVVDKYADGTPTRILVEPLRINTRVTLNSQPTDVTQQIVMTVLYPQEDCDATSDDIAFPQEWLAFLEWDLSLRCCPMSGRPWSQDMQLNWTNSRNMATGLNPEMSTLYFQCGAG